MGTTKSTKADTSKPKKTTKSMSVANPHKEDIMRINNAILSHQGVSKMNFSIHLNADCLDILPFIEQNSVDLIISDINYGVLNKNNPNSGAHSISFMDSELKKYCKAIKRIVKPTGTIVFFGTGIFTYRIMQELSDIYKYSLVWKKGNAVTGHLNSSLRPLTNHEDILIFQKDSKKVNSKHTYNPQMTSGAKRYGSLSAGLGAKRFNDNCYGRNLKNTGAVDTDSRYPTSILNFGMTEKPMIPGQKPLELYDWLIRTYSNKNDVILDPASGSGTAYIVAEHNERAVICIEKDAEIYNNACQRITTHSTKTGNVMETLTEDAKVSKLVF